MTDSKHLKAMELSKTTEQDADFDLTLEPSHGWVSLQLRHLWEFRELLYFLVWRDLKVRYKQTVLGVAWAILQPVFTMVVFSMFFGRLAKIPSDGLPYPIFSFAALVPWGFFSNGMVAAANSLVGNANLIQKIYFPRLIVPISAVLHVIWLPLFFLLAFIASLGVGLWLAAMNVQFRDVRHTLSFLVQAWLFCTPIAYPSSLLPEPWRSLYGLNPMAGVVEGFRWALLGTPAPGAIIWVSTLASLVVLISGAYYFRRMERIFADTV